MISHGDKLFWWGIIIYLAGLVLLPLADRMASNTAGISSPFLIIAGWALILKSLYEKE